MTPELPVARLLVDVALPHLDRPFDYAVPDGMAEAAVPGARVRVRFAGRRLDAFVLERCPASDHPGRLASIERVVSPEPVLTPAVAALCRAIADRWIGTMADVVRLAVPPRHARAEASVATAGPPVAGALPPVDPAGWGRYRDGAGMLAAIGAARPGPRAVWCASPGEDWAARYAEVAAAALAAGRGALLVVPDARDLAVLDAALGAALGPGRHVALSADLGPAERYRRFLAVRRGLVRVVAGTRAAAYAPVVDLGLVAVWDDGDDLHVEPHAPYPHAREVLLLRAHLEHAGALLGGWSRTAEGERLLRRGWARPLVADRATTRRTAPRVITTGDDTVRARDPDAAAARVPRVAFEAARVALAADLPVLVSVPRGGYLPQVACGRCRTPARCPHCHGPVRLGSSHAVPSCGWCGRPLAAWRCPLCDAAALRSVVVGADRTAEELGRAFPGVPVRTSGGGHVLDRVPAGRSLVVATPGAEPVVPGGYGAALLLDGWLALGLGGLRAGEEALRRWLAAAALVRPAADGGTVVVTADPSLRPVQALVRWDPAWAAAAELADRGALRLPPAAAVVALTGTAQALAGLVAAARGQPDVDVLGPVPVGGRPGSDEPVVEQVLLRCDHAALAGLAALVRAEQGRRSARKAPDVVRVQLDPHDVG